MHIQTSYVCKTMTKKFAWINLWLCLAEEPTQNYSPCLKESKEIRLNKTRDNRVRWRSEMQKMKVTQGKNCHHMTNNTEGHANLDSHAICWKYSLSKQTWIAFVLSQVYLKFVLIADNLSVFLICNSSIAPALRTCFLPGPRICRELLTTEQT